MRRRALVFAGVTAVLVAAAMLTPTAVTARQASQAETALQAAIRVETVDGNLKGAIEQYQKLANGADRAVAAKALVRLGQCYEKMGSSEARKAYERAVRDFAEQKAAAAEAQGRLAALAAPTRGGVTYRQVWTGPKVDVEGTVPSDGRYVSFPDWDTGDLALHDFTTGTDRRLTDKGSWDKSSEFAEESVLSRDGRQIVYSWFNGKDRYQLRVAAVPATGVVQPRTLIDSADVEWIAPYDWSPDGQWIAVAVSKKDKVTDIALISARDGSRRVIRTDVGDQAACRFSPDGRYLGYSVNEKGKNREIDVFVMTVDGGGESRAIVNPGRDVMMGWSPDGKLLLFATDRTGTSSLWALPVAEGKPAGEPFLLRPDVQGFPLGMTASGSMFVGSQISDRDIHLATVDFAAGKLAAAPSRPIQTFMGSNDQPDWSPDGKYLAYTAVHNTANGDKILAIRTLATGETRELHPNLRGFNWPRWAPDGTWFVSQGTDNEGRQGIWRIDAKSGAVTPIVLTPQGGPFLQRPQCSPDGRRIFYHRGVAVIERDLQSGTERDVFRSEPNRGAPVQGGISPDGRHAVLREFNASGLSVFRVMSIDGGEPRELVRAEPPQGLGISVAWTPDSKAVIVPLFFEGGNRRELWFIPIDGGARRKLDLPYENQAGMQVHPDGRQITYVSGQKAWEIMVLENFLPPRK